MFDWESLAVGAEISTSSVLLALMLLDRKWTLIVIGSAVLIYSIAVLGFIVTSPDIGLRVLLSEPGAKDDSSSGLEIRSTSHMIAQGKETIPQTGDRLLLLGDLRTHSFLDFASQFVWLRNAKPEGGPIYDSKKLLDDLQVLGSPALVETFGGERWVKAAFVRPETGRVHEAYLQARSLPLGEVCLSVLWFSLQLGFFLLSAFFCWNRPFDRSARVLFGLGIVALGAFIVGNHWWIMAAHPWLIVPCAVCGILLPAVFLHFFLVFPRPKLFLQRFRVLSLFAVYALPCLVVLATLVVVGVTSRIHTPGEEAGLANLVPILDGLRWGICGYLGLGTVYFLFSLFALWHSRRHTPPGKEQQQLRAIGTGGLLALVFVAIALGLALTDPVGFALGSGRVPMFLAAASFMAAFSVAIVRHQLMRVDQAISRNMLYYTVSLGLTGVISLMIALSILVPQWFNLSLSTQQALTVAAVLTLSVILLLWLRDVFQQMIDRQFFHDRYRLDKALKQIQQSVAKLSDPKSIAQLFLSACRDVLGVDRGALYLRTIREEPFQLMAFAGAGHAPAQLPLDSSFLTTLKEQGSLQRITPGSRSELSPEQALLWELDVDLVHGFDSSDDIAGIVLLGHRRHAIGFTSEDLTFLNALGQIANVAMYSAQVVDQNISRLNDELQLKLEKISEQQRQIAMLQAQLTHISDEPSRSLPAKSAFRREACKGNSPAMLTVLDMARKVAASESSVLIRGESGTGKEVLAQVLHDNSPRAGMPMIRVHCAALSPSLLESELFGHVKGAFTGAHQDRVGRFEAANGGTLFLDEIGDISLDTQIKLLRVLQERSFEPVGSVRTVHVDVRLITATHQNLEQLIEDGRFREDLFYRLNVIKLELPPLRARREDILELALDFLRRSAKRMGKPLSHIDDGALDALERYNWPGNIRELENVIERAVVMAEGTVLTRWDLPSDILSSKPSRRRDSARAMPSVAQQTAALKSDTLFVEPGKDPSAAESAPVESARPSAPKKTRRKLADLERQELQNVLEECGGNKAQAAQILGIPRSTLFSKLKRHGLT